MRLAMLVLFAVVSAGGTLGQFPQITHDGNGLLQACGAEKLKTEFEIFSYGYCSGVIDGVSRMMQLHGNSKTTRAAMTVCYPEGVTQDQTNRVVLKYLQEHPEALHITDVALVEVALNKAFPCGKKSPLAKQATSK